MAEYAQRVAALSGQAKKLFTKAVFDEVDSLIQKGDATGERQSFWELIKAALLKAKLAVKRKVPPEYVAQDPSNRNKMGATGGSSQRHGSKIQRIGFSLEKCLDATAIDAPGDTTVLMEHNRRQEQLSQGLVPPLVDAHIIVLGSTHTTIWLRQVKAEVRAVVAALADSEGKLNRANLTHNRPLFEQAIEHGIEYFTLHADCFAVWPNLQRFVHRVLNTEARGIVGEVEIMMGMVEQASEAGPLVDWQAIELDAASSMPTCEHYVGTLRKYVECNSGGADGPLVVELVDFTHAFEHTSQRSLGGEFLDALLKVRVADYCLGEEIPYLKNAAVKANLNGPKVVDNVCRTIAPSNLVALAKSSSKKEVMEGETLLAKAREMASSLPHIDRVRVLATLDQRVIMHLLGKGAILGKAEVYASIMDICKVARFAFAMLYTIAAMLQHGSGLRCGSAYIHIYIYILDLIR